jgi:hypothetical protein
MHKDFAPWAPLEAEGKSYQKKLEKQVKLWLNEKI